MRDVPVPGAGWVNMECVWRWNGEFAAIEHIGKMLNGSYSTCRTSSVRPCRSCFVVWWFWRLSVDRALPSKMGRRTLCPLKRQDWGALGCSQTEAVPSKAGCQELSIWPWNWAPRDMSFPKRQFSALRAAVEEMICVAEATSM